MITRDDIRLYKAQDNTDNDSGGGAMTSAEVVDGVVNNLFPSLSRVDATAGVVHMRKLFLAVKTANQDHYRGAHAIVRKGSTDERIGLILVSTGDPFDNRKKAQELVEAYLNYSYAAPFYLFGRHIKGMKALTFLSRLNEVSPEVGQVYYLADEEHGQYVRVDSVEDTNVTFSFSVGGTFMDFTRKRSVVTLDQRLEHDFIGSGFHPTGNTSAVEAFNTIDAKAVTYHGTKQLVADFTTQQTTMQLDSIYEQLVPSTLRQNPLISKSAVPNVPLLLSAVSPDQFSGSMPYDASLSVALNASYNLSSSNSYRQTISVGGPIQPGSLRINGEAVDDGDAVLFSGTTLDNDFDGYVDYLAGQFTVTTTVGRSGTFNITFIPATVVEVPARHTAHIDITTANNGTAFVQNLLPAPSFGSLRVEFRAGGKWQTLTANGVKTIGADPAIGLGIINYNGDGTATASISLGAEPDVGSQIIWSWAAAWGYQEHSGVQPIDWHYELLIPGTEAVDKLSLNANWSGRVDGQWLRDGNTLTPDSVASGSITASYDDQSRKVTIHSIKTGSNEDTLPDELIIDWDLASTVEAKYSPQSATAAPDGSGVVAVSLGVEIAAGRFYIAYPLTYTDNTNRHAPVTRTVTAYVNHVGQVYSLSSGQDFVPVSSILSSNQLSNFSVNSGTGEVTFHPTNGLASTVMTYQVYESVVVGINGADNSPRYRYKPVDKHAYRVTAVSLAGSDFTYAAAHGGESSAPAGNNITTIDMKTVDAVLQFPKRISSDMAFVWAGTEYVARNGLVYAQFNHFTGIGVQCGVVDKLAGVVRLRPQAGNVINIPDVNIKQLVTNEYSQEVRPVVELGFRTALTNVNPSSLQIRGSKYQVTETADTDAEGNAFNQATTSNETSYTLTINPADNSVQGDADITGILDSNNGIVTLQGINDWFLYPDTIKYDAVSETRQPIDAQLLGLNPVRLPATGRVPVINQGGQVVIFHEEEQAITPAAGATVNCGRTNLALVEVLDSEGQRLDYHQYTTDRAAGTLTFNDPLTLQTITGETLTPPFKLIHRIENMRSVTGVDITGRVSVSTPPDRDFPVGTRVADAVLFGNVYSRIYGLFHQESWNAGAPVWSDERIGDDTTAKFDAINYPITIVNEGSTTERWLIRFITATRVQVVGENLGVVLDNHDISINGNDIAPINPATGTPYWVMRQAGFGSGWTQNNCIRFNSDGANANMWVIRTAQPGAATEFEDSFELEGRGDAN